MAVVRRSEESTRGVGWWRGEIEWIHGQAQTLLGRTTGRKGARHSAFTCMERDFPVHCATLTFFPPNQRCIWCPQFHRDLVQLEQSHQTAFVFGGKKKKKMHAQWKQKWAKPCGRDLEFTIAAQSLTNKGNTKMVYSVSASWHSHINMFYNMLAS